MDSLADTCAMGRTFVLYEVTGAKCTVTPYSSEYDLITVDVSNGGTLYDHPEFSETFILDVNHGLDFIDRYQ